MANHGPLLSQHHIKYPQSHKEQIMNDVIWLINIEFNCEEYYHTRPTMFLKKN